VNTFRQWYEKQVLGCPLERWQEVKCLADLDRWLNESESHKAGDLGFFMRFCREAGLHKMGKGTEKFLSYGGVDMPRETAVRGSGNFMIPGGFFSEGSMQSFHHEEVAEHVAYSWFNDYGGGRHPFVGETRPYATGYEGQKYSWCKAPRYSGHTVETGPLAQMMIMGNPLIREIVKVEGASSYVRELARLMRPAFLLPAMDIWTFETIQSSEPSYTSAAPPATGAGHGLIEATRGALGHWVKLQDGKIVNYQVITPTAWNGSPRDSEGQRGAWEEALIGTRVQDPDNPVEIGHVVRSYDPCLVCTVHMIRNGKRDIRVRI
jgi:Ni,Fe-hydrogenase I large subunit